MRPAVSLCSVLALLLSATVALAGGGDPAYLLSASDGSGATGDAIALDIAIDSSAGGDLQGWSFGLCSDPSALQVDSLTLGAASLIADDGGFIQQTLFSDGITLGVVVNLLGSTVIPPSASVDVAQAGYTILGTTDTAATFCNSLGTPPVATVVVVGGQSISPVLDAGLIDVLDPNELVMSSATAILGNSVDTVVSFNSVAAPEADAASLSLTYDAAICTPTNIANTAGADFFAVQATAAGEIVLGLIMDTGSGTAAIPASPSQTDLVTITWSCDAEGTSALSFTDGLGSPPADNELILGQSGGYQPTLVDGSLTVINYNPFVRGNCNDDIVVDLGDAIFLLNYLFQGGPAPNCDDACDFDDDADLGIPDAVGILNYQFLGGAAPAAPFPDAGLDPTPGDGFGCNGDADDQ
ncbi:MAG: hypothetical protein ACYTGJ_12315 [Planctomycetota bacterium]